MAITPTQQQDAQKLWKDLNDKAYESKGVTKAQIEDVKTKLQADGFDVSATSKLGQQLNTLETVIDNTTTQKRSNLETDTTWAQAATAVSALVADPTTNTTVDTAAAYSTTSTALGADISANQTLTAKLATDTTAGDKTAMAQDAANISSNVDTQIQHVQDGVANGSIDSTLGERMVGYLQQAKAAINTKAADGSAAPNMTAWNDMTKFYATSLSQVTATDNGGAAAAAGTAATTAGTGTIATAAAAATASGVPANATPWTDATLTALIGDGTTAFAKYASVDGGAGKLSGQVVKDPATGKINIDATVQNLTKDKVQLYTSSTGNFMTYDPSSGGGGVFDAKGGSIASPASFYPSSASKSGANANTSFDAGGFHVAIGADGKSVAVSPSAATAATTGTAATPTAWTNASLTALVGDGTTAFAKYASVDGGRGKLSGQVVKDPATGKIDIDATVKNLIKDNVQLYTSATGNFMTYDPSSGGGGVFDANGGSIASPGAYYPSSNSKKDGNAGLTFDSGGFHVVIGSDGKSVAVNT